MIGNGNDLAERWANAGSNGAGEAKLHIEDPLCSGDDAKLQCQFGLLREGGVVTYRGAPTPDKLSCTANFQHSADGKWVIPLLPPPPQGGHTRITIKCEAIT